MFITSTSSVTCQSKFCSIDRLVLIIINLYFNFYRYWSASNRTLHSRTQLLELNNAAYQCWQDGLVTVVDAEIVRVIDRERNEVFEVNSRLPHCSCFPFMQTGKFCVHILAASIIRNSGSVEEWKHMYLLR